MLAELSANLSWHVAIAAILTGYALGSIAFGPLLARLAGLGDITTIGSGNIGATNVLRTGHKGLAALTLLGDLLKGTAATAIAALWGGEAQLIAGLSAFIGHLFPIWLKFKGGKGVATYIGILLGLYWPAAAIFCAIWLSVAFLTRYSSLSALIAALFTPGILAAFGKWPVVALMAILTVLIFVTHRANIARLIAGKETKIGAEP